MALTQKSKILVSDINTALNGKLSTSGGTLSGAITFSTEYPIKRDVDTSRVVIAGATSYNKGSFIVLNGIDHSSGSGIARVVAVGADGNFELNLNANEDTAQVGGKNIVLSVNGNEATAAGAVTIPNMTKATSSAAGKAGLVPAPAKGYQTRFLRGDATWQAISISGTALAQLITPTTEDAPSTSWYGKGIITVPSGGIWILNGFVIYEISKSINEEQTVTALTSGSGIFGGFTTRNPEIRQHQVSFSNYGVTGGSIITSNLHNSQNKGHTVSLVSTNLYAFRLF